MKLLNREAYGAVMDMGELRQFMGKIEKDSPGATKTIKEWVRRHKQLFSLDGLWNSLPLQDRAEIIDEMGRQGEWDGRCIISEEGCYNFMPLIPFSHEYYRQLAGVNIYEAIVLWVCHADMRKKLMGETAVGELGIPLKNNEEIPSELMITFLEGEKDLPHGLMETVRFVLRQSGIALVDMSYEDFCDSPISWDSVLEVIEDCRSADEFIKRKNALRVSEKGARRFVETLLKCPWRRVYRGGRLGRMKHWLVKRGGM